MDISSINVYGSSWFGVYWPNIILTLWTIIKIVCITLPVMGLVAYLTLWERKMIGWMHVRLGPNRVGPVGLLQPIADALKLLLKEIVIPARSNKALFILAPIMTIMPALVAWSMIPFGPDIVLANVNAGLLLLMSIILLAVSVSCINFLRLLRNVVKSISSS